MGHNSRVTGAGRIYFESNLHPSHITLLYSPLIAITIKSIIIKYEDLLNETYFIFKEIVEFINKTTSNVEKINKNKLKALYSSVRISGNLEKEIEAYVMEDKPRKVKEAIKKYCL